VIEYNARFGDPEAQVVLPLLKSDLLDILEACMDNSLGSQEIVWSDKHACVVVMASGGYPGSYNTGKIISGLECADRMTDVYIFHAGTKLDNGNVVTSGGRVLGVTAIAETKEQAIDRAYEFVQQISFDKAHYRTDIGRTC
jgi:phosphoribosylamine--glycine ligase